ncbi:MAG: class II fumarate hydratase [Armatimonadetes bacterium]|nr:class II fumarate hydratase [Armatimonadota bacterium]
MKSASATGIEKKDEHSTPGYRVEKDSLGEMRVPVNAYYGAQTARAVENFPISGLVFPHRFIYALGLIKRACARANMDLGDLDRRIGGAIVQAATEVMDGRWDGEFVLDIFQTGSGTSTNMNANEVIANRASEILGAPRGSKTVHPNDHVNMGQSSNDVIPTAIHVAAATAISEDLVRALQHLHEALAAKAAAFDGILKSGRTHLMDATPVRLGQEFGGYAEQVKKGIERATRAREVLLELALGGTAVGTGLNRRPQFPERAISYISNDTGLSFREARNHFEAQGGRDACVEASGELKTIAASLMKIANDIRWMGSGPRTGIGEITLPATQPGSSIMPGKVNPVMCEAVTMVAAQVIGNDATIALCGMTGNFELNVMMPVMAYDLLQSVRLLSSVSLLFADRCIVGIQANKEKCQETVERNLAICTSLAPRIGYDQAAAISKEAHASSRTVREVAKEKKVLPDAEIDSLLDFWKMTEPGDLGQAGG